LGGQAPSSRTDQSEATAGVNRTATASEYAGIAGADGQVVATARPHWAVFLGLASIIAVVDQVSKAWIVANFQVGDPVRIIGDAVRIVLVHNNGALFGMFRDQAVVFAAFSVLVIGLIVAFQARAGSDLLVSIALGLLVGGAIGNFIDRVRLGYVVDFADLGIGSWRWYTFNVADAAISISILVLLSLALRPSTRSTPRG
jgi:signal peptidase II